MPGIELKALYMLGRHSATELPVIPPQPHTPFFFETGFTCICKTDLEFSYVGQIHLEIMILLPLDPDCWDCRHIPSPFLA